MKIMGGHYKNKNLMTIKANNFRPSSALVKETIFNLILHRFEPYIHGATLDIFAGSGALGIEALSRGSKDLTLVEKNRYLVNVIYKNIVSCEINQAVQVLAKNFLHTHKSNFKFKYTIVFLDPPYKSNLLPKSLSHLLSLDILEPNSLIITESHDISDNITSDLKDKLELLHEHKIQSKALRFYNLKPKT